MVFIFGIYKKRKKVKLIETQDRNVFASGWVVRKTARDGKRIPAFSSKMNKVQGSNV